jgi:hypothetical protein
MLEKIRKKRYESNKTANAIYTPLEKEVTTFHSSKLNKRIKKKNLVFLELSPCNDNKTMPVKPINKLPHTLDKYPTGLYKYLKSYRLSNST